jgi:hypothetical protein
MIVPSARAHRLLPYSKLTGPAFVGYGTRQTPFSGIANSFDFAACDVRFQTFDTEMEAAP